MTRLWVLPLLYMLFLFSCKPKEQTTQPEIKTLTEAVYASGSLIAENEYKVVSSLDGYLIHVLAKEGDSVQKGQLLFTIQNNNRNAAGQSAVSMLQKTLPLVSTNAPLIKELQSQYLLSMQKLQNDSIQYRRYKNLYENAAISKSQYEKYELQYQSSQTEIQRIQEQLNNQQLNAAIQKQQVTNQLNQNKTDIGNGILKSFATGVVYEVYKQEGDFVNINQPVAMIGSGKMIAKLSIDEDDLYKVSLHQKVLITIDAYPGKIFSAAITKIYPVLNKIEQSFRADAEFVNETPGNIYGLNIEANIIVSENEKVMVIPKSFLQNGDSVSVKNNGSITKVKITKGIEDENWVQITSGITTSSLLIIPQ